MSSGLDRAGVLSRLHHPRGQRLLHWSRLRSVVSLAAVLLCKTNQNYNFTDSASQCSYLGLYVPM